MLTKTKFSHLRAKTAGAGAVGDHESEDPPEVAVLMLADTKRRCLLWQPSEHTARGALPVAAQRQLQLEALKTYTKNRNGGQERPAKHSMTFRGRGPRPGARPGDCQCSHSESDRVGHGAPRKCGWFGNLVLRLSRLHEQPHPLAFKLQRFSDRLPRATAQWCAARWPILKFNRRFNRFNFNLAVSIWSLGVKSANSYQTNKQLGRIKSLGCVRNHENACVTSNWCAASRSSFISEIV